VSRKCDICGKTSSVGNTIKRSGSPKYKGGIGLHTGGITKRRFYPNIQRIKVIINGTVMHAKVCTRCMKAGKVKRAPVRPGQIARTLAAENARIAAAEAARVAAEQAVAAAVAEAAAAEAAEKAAEEQAKAAAADDEKKERKERREQRAE
jgi:large subunit ribosomal protein L28